jgi:2,3-bisphosphoglycerate-independent phosphoglycerate mutase
MVGHTGVMEAAIKACETVDRCARSVAEKAVSLGYAVLVLADHGNADCMRNPDGSPNTAHTTQPVPCHLLGVSDKLELRSGVLGDVAPTLLEIMGVDQAPEMTGKSLIVR